MPKSSLSLDDVLLLSSPSGHEHSVRSFYTQYFRDKANAVGVDIMGNSSVVSDGGIASGKLMLIAHSDEVGFFVSGIEDEGFLRIRVLGCIDRTFIQGRSIDIITKDGTINGVVGKRPIHYIQDSDEGKSDIIDDMYVDIGARSRKEVEKIVSIGDAAVWSSGVTRLRNNLVCSRGIDNKVGVYTIMRVMENILNSRKKSQEVRATSLKYSVYGVLSSMEEIGGSGSAYVAASNIRPSACIVVETEESSDYPDSSGCNISIFGGPVIDRGVFINRVFSDYIINTASKLRVPFQVSVSDSSTATDLDDIRAASGGVPCALVSIPIRYMHSPVSVFDSKVVEKTIKLLTYICENIHSEVFSFLPNKPVQE